jgi:GT2 family glycosyltransferase
VNADDWRAAQRELRARLRVLRPATHGDGGTPEPDVQTPAPRPLASVIVVCRNAGDLLGRCLEHLLVQDYPAIEIIVVDDASDDDTVAVAQASASRGELRLVRSAQHRGCPCARNLGVRHASGEIIAFIDADGFATPTWLSELVRIFASDPGIGGVASTVFYDDDPVVLNGAGGTVNRQGWAADLSMNESYETAQIAAEALYPMGCGMAFRREAIDRVGPFDDAMLNYYDDVDYGTRLWRAGYRVAVAADAWVDHAAAGGDSPRKRLLCERHRMRVVLKHAPAHLLSTWSGNELRSLADAPAPERRQKLAAIAWNVRHLASALASRRRDRHLRPAPEGLLDDSWGDAFPAGVPPRAESDPARAGARIEMGDPADRGQLLHGWFPAEQLGEGTGRWAAAHAAVLISSDRPARRLHLDYVHVPVDNGDVGLAIRRIGSSDPLASIWSTRLRWQHVARSVENHPIELPAGDYEAVFSVADGWLEPPLNVRRLAVAVVAISLEESFDAGPGGLDMSAPSVEGQLVRGWFEAEQAPTGAYRWSGDYAAAVVRVAEHAKGMRLRYRMPPAPGGTVTVTLTRMGTQESALSWPIPWQPGDWHDETVAADLAAGDYVVGFHAAETWTNPEQRETALPPENRALGVAVAALDFS